MKSKEVVSLQAGPGICVFGRYDVSADTVDPNRWDVADIDNELLCVLDDSEAMMSPKTCHP